MIVISDKRGVGSMSSNVTVKRGINRGMGVEGPAAQAVIYGVMTFVIFLVVLPLVITILSSIKTNYELSGGVWSLPKTPKWTNWLLAFDAMSLNMINSILVCLIATAGIILISSISAFVFVRHDFIGKEIIFSAIIALMVVPSVLTLTPLYLLILKLGLKDNWWALFFPYIAGGQVGAIFLFRTFLSQQPGELFEAARIDGAGELTMYWRIAMPLAIPVLSIQAVGLFAGFYNDFLWPVIVIDQQKNQTLMPILRTITEAKSFLEGEGGVSYAMYLLSGIPLVFTTVFGLKYFINGDFASGLKL